MNDQEIRDLSHAYWSGRAQDFSDLRMAEYETPMRPRLREYIRGLLPQGERVCALDAGCGAGFLSILLLELGCRVTAVDFSAEMLVQAEKNIREKGFENGFELQQMDLQQLSFESGRFAMVISRNVLWTIPDAEAAYLEMFRVLKSGGVLLNMDANYGKAFNEADAKGKPLVHPTQTQAQLRMRNRIVRDLPVTKADRPLWDLELLRAAGASEVTCQEDILEILSIDRYDSASAANPERKKSGMFAVIARK